MPTPDVLLHPVRLRVVQALLGDRSLTTARLAAELPDVPKPTLYRHIAALVDAGVLRVAGERPVRGAVERTYRLDEARASADPAAAGDMTDQEHRASFAVFTAGLVAAFEAFLAERSAMAATEAAFGYRTAALHVPPEEIPDFARRVREAVAPWREPTDGAERYLFSTVLIPADTTHPASE